MVLEGPQSGSVKFAMMPTEIGPPVDLFGLNGG